MVRSAIASEDESDSVGQGRGRGVVIWGVR